MVSKHLKIMIILMAFISLLCSCSEKKTAEDTNQMELDSNKPAALQLPEWAKTASIYEVNLRQYTPSGTINEFIPHLDRLQDMGVKILWLMPIYPISEIKRKATGDSFTSDIEDPNERKKYLGSPYAVADYKDVNPDFGTEEEFRHLVNEAHNRGMKVILDYVPNHTGWDHPWIEEHPEWYTKNTAGKITDPINEETGEPWGWEDVADLDFTNDELRKAHIDNLLYWIDSFQVDGYRHDVAHGVPTDFWMQATRAILEHKPDVLLLAESEKPELKNNYSFHVDYGWELHHLMNDIAKGIKSAHDIPNLLQSKADQKGSFMYFTSNHDENSWAGTELERMPKSYKTFEALTFVLDGIPLIYSGQEEPLTKRLAFFTKDTIPFENYSLHDFYRTLHQVKQNKALWNRPYGGEIDFLSKSGDVLVIKRSNGINGVFGIFNLSDETNQMDTRVRITGIDAMTDSKVSIQEGMSLDPWQYKIVVVN